MSATYARACARLRERLVRRYPGVTVMVDFLDKPAFERWPAYKGWRIYFAHNDPDVLIGYGLVPTDCNWESSGISELVGISWNAYGANTIPEAADRCCIGFHIAQEGEASVRRARPLTKARQAQVARLLKPFVRGTWKPGEEVRS